MHVTINDRVFLKEIIPKQKIDLHLQSTVAHNFQLIHELHIVVRNIGTHSAIFPSFAIGIRYGRTCFLSSSLYCHVAQKRFFPGSFSRYGILFPGIFDTQHHLVRYHIQPPTQRNICKHRYSDSSSVTSRYTFVVMHFGTCITVVAVEKLLLFPESFRAYVLVIYYSTRVLLRSFNAQIVLLAASYN